MRTQSQIVGACDLWGKHGTSQHELDINRAGQTFHQVVLGMLAVIIVDTSKDHLCPEGRSFCSVAFRVLPA